MNAPINKNRLFLASSLALLVTSLSFAIRAKVEFVFGHDYGLTKEEIGWSFGPAFWGFTIAMFAGGMIIDIVKTKRVIWGAFFLHVIGLTMLVMSQDKTLLFLSNIFIGLANGSIEAACNPMIATIYPNDKTKMLNRFHVWFPGGIVIGGILSWLLMDNLGISWQVLTALLFIPLGIYGYLFFGQTIPDTERVISGASYKQMVKNVAAPYTIIIIVSAMILIASVPGWSSVLSGNNVYYLAIALMVSLAVEAKVINKMTLLFPFMFLCMFLTASTELGTNQWINALLENSGMNPMLILVLISGLMAVGRYFAGPVIHRLHPSGVLFGSVVLSFLGLISLSYAESTFATLAAALVFALGVCYLWPTMLGFVAEYIPKSGALGLAILGGTGMVATSLVLPIMGSSIDVDGAQLTLRSMSVLPLILIVLFLGLFIFMKFKYSRKDNDLAQ